MQMLTWERLWAPVLEPEGNPHAMMVGFVSTPTRLLAAARAHAPWWRRTVTIFLDGSSWTEVVHQRPRPTITMAAIRSSLDPPGVIARSSGDDFMAVSYYPCAGDRTRPGLSDFRGLASKPAVFQISNDDVDLEDRKQLV